MNPVDALYKWAEICGPPGDPRRVPLVRGALECVDDPRIIEEDREVLEAVRRYVNGEASVDDVYDARRQIRSSLMCPALALAIMVYGIRPWAEVRWICYPRGHEHCAEVLTRHTGLQDIRAGDASIHPTGFLRVLMSIFNVKSTPDPRQTALVPAKSRGTP